MAPVLGAVVTTLAGQPYTYKLIDGKANVAVFNQPIGLAVDGAGAIYFAEFASHAIRKLAFDGTVSTVAGFPGANGSVDGKGTAARFNHPVGLAIDKAGNLYISDSDNDRIRKMTPEGVVTTFAGSSGGWLDAKGVAAKFNVPRGMAFDAAGNLIVADGGNQRIRSIAPDGTVTTVAGNGQSGKKDGAVGTATFYSPTDVAVDAKGNIWVSESINHAIRKITPGGVVSTVAGGTLGSADGVGAAAKFGDLWGLALDASGAAYVADRSNHRIRKVLADGTVTTVAGAATGFADGIGAAALFAEPIAVRFDVAGRLLISDHGNDRLRSMELRRHGCDDANPCTVDVCNAATGKCGTDAKGICDDGNPCTIDSCDSKGACVNGNIADGASCASADGCTTAVQCSAGRCTPNALLTTLAGKEAGNTDGKLADARFDHQERIIRDGAGGFYVADSGNDTIRRISATGAVTTIAGAPWAASGYIDGPATIARFNSPSGLALDSKGNVFVADTNNNRIRRLAPDGTVSTFAGGTGIGLVDGPPGKGEFFHPQDLRIDKNGVLYVADAGHTSIRKIMPDGTSMTLAGANTPGFVDGQGAAARFSNPCGLDLDAAGNVYVADTGNHAIRVVTPFGLVSTVAGTGDTGYVEGIAPFGIRFAGPYGVAVDGVGNVFVADTGNHRLRVVLTDGKSYSVAGNGIAGSADGQGIAATLSAPRGLLLLDNADLLVTTVDDDRIRKMASPLKGCDDGNACTVDVCAAKLGCQHVVLANASACSDGNPCTPDDGCFGGACKASAAVAGCQCVALGACGDGNSCTTDSCDPKLGCQHLKVADDTPCDDGSACTLGEACVAGACQPSASAWAMEPWAGAEPTAPGQGAGKRDGTRRPRGTTESSALFSGPQGSVLDAAGNLYVTEGAANTIRRIGADGLVTVIAGSPYVASGHADGPSTSALFKNPRGIGLDAAGNLYVADSGNHVIRKIDPDGNVTTLAGQPGKSGFADGLGSAALFYGPFGLTADPAGVLYVADSLNNRIRRISQDGVVTTWAGSAVGIADGLGTAAKFNSPKDIAMAPDGSLVVADYASNAVRRISPAGLVTTLAGGIAAGWQDGVGLAAARFWGPIGVTVDKQGAIYVADMLNNRVRRISPAGTVTTIAGNGTVGGAVGAGLLPALNQPYGVTADQDGRIYVMDKDNHRVVRLRQVGGGCDDGSPCTTDSCNPKTGCSHGVADPALACPDGGPCVVPTCDDKAGRCVYSQPVANGAVCDKPGSCQRQCTGGGCMAAGIAVTAAGGDTPGSDDGVASVARFNQPQRMVVDAQGTVYVADTYNHRIRKITADGVVSTLAGSDVGYAEGKGSLARFSSPRGICLGTGGVVYVADTGNQRIRKILADGTVVTVAGATKGMTDAAATLAQFNSPVDVAADALGNVYVADQVNHRIRKIAASGSVTTLSGTTQGFADGTAANARFNYPAGLDIDDQGVLYVADTNNHAIRRVQADGSVQTIAGLDAGYLNGHGRLGARFSSPTDLAVAPDGSLLVADRDNAAVRRVTQDGTATTLAGLASKGFADGMGSDARFNLLEGVAIDKAGHIFVADTVNHRIRRIDMQWSSCTSLMGVSRSTAGKSCKLLQPLYKWSGLGTFWVDPDGGSKDNALKTACDMTTDGGGWTRINATVASVTVAGLRGNSARQLLKCSDDGTAAVESPPSAAAWSWTQKSQVPGDWLVDGKVVACGGDASFDNVQCGWGYGCSTGAAAGMAKVLPGVSGGNQCTSTSAAETSQSFSICGGAGNYASWSVYVRSED